MSVAKRQRGSQGPEEHAELDGSSARVGVVGHGCERVHANAHMVATAGLDGERVGGGLAEEPHDILRIEVAEGY